MRTSTGQFAKGSTGNPNGRPPVESLAEQIRAAGTPDLRQLMFQKMWAAVYVESEGPKLVQIAWSERAVALSILQAVPERHGTTPAHGRHRESGTRRQTHGRVCALLRNLTQFAGIFARPLLV